MNPVTVRTAASVLFTLVFSILAHAEDVPGTKPLTIEGDLARVMVNGIDKYLMRELDVAATAGADRWQVKTDSLKSYLASVKPNRDRLQVILGVVDPRVTPVEIEYVGTERVPSLVAQTAKYKVYAIRWPVLAGIDGEGLLLEPTGAAKASVVALPDADQTPEQLVGLSPGIPADSQFARRFAESGCRVVVPVLINRQPTWSGSVDLNRQTNLSHREFIWRMAYEMGRHILGYEIQKVLAAVDWLKRKNEALSVGVMGYGEGGLVALYSGALDPRIAATVVSGVGDGTRQHVWKEPIDRSIWASLPEFRDEHLRKLFGANQLLIYEHSLPPTVDGPPVLGNNRQAAPGKIEPTAALLAEIEALKDPNLARFHSKVQKFAEVGFDARVITPFQGQSGCRYVLEAFMRHLNAGEPAPSGAAAPPLAEFDPSPRQKRQFDQLVAFTQRLWRVSDRVRQAQWLKIDTAMPANWDQLGEGQRKEMLARPQVSSQENFSQASARHRDIFWNELIGKLPKPTMPLNPRSRQTYDTPKWTGHEIVLDLYPDVIAYGILLLPKNLKPGEKRPVVVCQHGLEGRPQDVVEPKRLTPFYRSFGAQLADMGYIVFAPQNPYIFMGDFRILLRKSHPLKQSLYAFIVRQHEAATDWLASLPFVDPDKIAFYGLSYGGKTAMRIPAIVQRYCLSICSGDFNEWVGKNVSVDFRGSYMWTIEYDMYEFNLGHTYSYAEMAAMIAPRPFMVERGHDDGVGIDEMISTEYAKVRYLYANRLKIPDRTVLEFQPGGHEIFLKGTADFLKRHLGYP